MNKTIKLTGSCELTSSKKASGPGQFHILAYTGAAMKVDAFPIPVVIDLVGCTFSKDKTPIIADHNPVLRVGHSTSQQINAEGVTVNAVVSSGMDVAKGILEDAKAGFPFQASIGAEIVSREMLDAGNTEEVNGRTIEGPAIIARESIINEVSLVTLGADRATLAIAASLHSSPKKESSNMTIDLNKQRELQAAEEERVDTIRATIVQYPHLKEVELNGSKLPLTAAKAEAIRCGMSGNAFRLAVMTADRDNPHVPSGGPAIHIHAGYAGQTEVLECAMAQHVGMRSIEKEYSEQALEASRQLAVTHFMDAARIAATHCGFQGDWRNKDSVIKAAFSTADFSTLLTNVANKSLLQAYNTYPSVARLISKKLSANDFKTHTGVKLSGDTQFQKVAGDGELKHAVLEDSAYTYAIETYGRLFGIDRQSMIGDDLGALNSLPQLLGRGCAQCIEETFWTLVLANTSSFFHSDNSNLETAALDGDGLAALVQLFLEQTDSQSKPINVVPKTLVVPPALKAVGDELWASRTWNEGASSANDSDRVATANPHHGKYEPVASPWAGANGGLTGGSDTAYYLFGDPEDVAAFGIAYLDNREEPTIQQEEMEFNKLGMQWRGYLDLGICQVDHRGAAKSTGAG